MTIEAVPFCDLSNLDLYKIMQLREKVFVLEQTCLYQDLDNIDQSAWHVFATENDAVVAYARVFVKNTAENMVQIGRVVTEMDYRRKNIGTEIMNAAITVAYEKLNAQQIYLEAQTYAIPFYSRLGFKIVSEEFLEDGIPHVKMIK